MMMKYASVLGCSLMILVPSVALAGWAMNHPLPNDIIFTYDRSGTGDAPASISVKYRVVDRTTKAVNQEQLGTSTPSGGWYLYLPANLTVLPNQAAQIVEVTTGIAHVTNNITIQ